MAPTSDHSEPPLIELASLLNLRTAPAFRGPDGPEAEVAPVEARFLADSHWTPYGPLYGGQAMAQAVIAAGRTGVGGAHRVHSLHATFVEPGDTDRAVELQVRRLRTSRHYALRQVQVVQGASLLMTATVSFADSCKGPEHQMAMPKVPGPGGLSNLAQHLSEESSELARYLSAMLPVEQRHIEGPVSIPHRLTSSMTQACWMRALGDLGADPLRDVAALTYMSDYIVMEAALRRHALSASDANLLFVTLNHSIWFHRPARADRWLLFCAHSPSAADGLALGTTYVIARSGEHVATVSQEAVMRLRP